MGEVMSKTKAAREAALKLANIPSEVKTAALSKAASAISKNTDFVLKANKKDIELATRLLAKGKLSKSFVQRLKLDEDKLKEIVRMIESVAKLEDPIGKTLYSMELDEGLELYKISCPIGVIGSIFEARPDVLPQISSLCLKSGNAIILKGGREAKHSNEALFELMRKATEGAGIPQGWIQLIEARKDVRELLKLDEYIDLLVPRGSKSSSSIYRRTRASRCSATPKGSVTCMSTSMPISNKH